MIRSPEHIRPAAITPEETASPTMQLHAIRERADEMHLSRKNMLRTLTQKIGKPLFEILEKKIEYEHASLIAWIDADSGSLDAKKKLNLILKTEYFTKRPLEIDLF